MVRIKLGHLINPSSHIKNLEKEEQNKTNASKRKETIKVKADNNETENRKTTERKEQVLCL